MNYPFECRNCGYKETITMPITEYSADNHFCSSCGEEMVREVKSLVCGMSIDKTNSFLKRTSIWN